MRRRIFRGRARGRMGGRTNQDEGPPRRMLDFFFLTAVAFAMTATPVLLHQVGQPLAIAFCLAAACFLVIYFERAVPIVILVSYLFQTMFVAMASPYVTQSSDLAPMK